MQFIVPLALSLTLAIIIHASMHGGGPERLGAIIIGCWVGSDPLYHLLFGPSQFQSFDAGHAILDALEFGMLVWLASRANRFWPMIAAAAQLTALLAHLSALIGAEGMQRSYWTLSQGPMFIQLLALILGTIAHRGRLRRIGSYRDWRLQRRRIALRSGAASHGNKGFGF